MKINGRDRRGDRTGHRAFTLIEIVVVIAILATMLGVAIPLFHGTLAKKRAEAILQDLTMTLRLANQKSVFQQKDHDFVVDFKNRAYWLEFLEESGRSRKLRVTRTELRQLPGRFEFLLVYFPDRDDREDRRKTTVNFRPDGTATDAIIVVGREDFDSIHDYDHLQVIEVRGSDARIKILEEDDEERDRYVAML